MDIATEYAATAANINDGFRNAISSSIMFYSSSSAFIHLATFLEILRG
jgi:hypothetical protein